MLWIADPDGRCTFLSRSWFEFTGQTPQTGLGTGWIEAVHPEDRDRTMAVFEAASRKHEPFRLEYRLRAEDGTYRWAIAAARPRLDETGESRGYIGAVIDISDRKEAETALERLYRDLEEANRLKDEFLATLSHELRTPLNAVLGWAQVLRSGPLKPSVQERALDSLERNARAQAQLVEDLLDVSRIMSGKLHIKTEPVNLAAIVTNAIETVRAGVTAKQQHLEIQIEDRERLHVAGDPDRLQQIVWNLVSNAIKFTPSGGRIEIRLRSVGEVAELSVRDNGQGIAASFLPYVFERFRQMDGSTVRRQGGLGLGLSIARHVAEAHGGTVVAESAGPGKGATFYLRLPLQPTAAADEPARVPRATSVARVLSGIRALVVDDEADARELVEYILEASGAEVVSAASVADALRLTRDQPFDVLVADIGMPERDGYSLIRAIRDDPSASVRGLPAVAVTAYASARERRQVLDAGFNWHLTKPINPEQLVASVFTALGR
jgi:PAS domain S-box-containing protein